MWSQKSEIIACIYTVHVPVPCIHFTCTLIPLFFFLFLFSPFSPPLSLSLQVYNKYRVHKFDDDLCTFLRRAGCHDEKIMFRMDESNVLDSERMKTLLANGEVRSEGGIGRGKRVK